jgi:hypothetical protein
MIMVLVKVLRIWENPGLKPGQEYSMINPCLVKEVAEKILCEIQAMKVLKNVSL